MTRALQTMNDALEARLAELDATRTARAAELAARLTAAGKSAAYIADMMVLVG